MFRLLAAAALAAVLATGAPAAVADEISVETATGPVAVPHAPEKIAVFDIGILDTLDAIGVAPEGVVNRIYVTYLDDIAEQAEPVGTLFEPDVEALHAMQPDLIIVGPRTSTKVDMLQKIAPTIDMSIWGDNYLEQTTGRLSAFGRIFDRQEEADALRSKLETLVAETREVVDGKGTALIIMTNGPKISAYGKNSRFGWLHSDLGIPPAKEDIEDSRHGEVVSFEYVHEINPDWLIVIDRAAAIGQDGEHAKQTLENALISNTSAWKNDHVIYLDPAKAYVAMGGVQATTDLVKSIRDAFAQ